jgi:hypothetical protein
MFRITFDAMFVPPVSCYSVATDDAFAAGQQGAARQKCEPADAAAPNGAAVAAAAAAKNVRPKMSGISGCSLAGKSD